jgi:hypothetical protein
MGALSNKCNKPPLQTGAIHVEKTMKLSKDFAANKTFLDISNAAELAGFSQRHFRRIIELDRIRVMRIGRKCFILGADFEQWKATKKTKLTRFS